MRILATRHFLRQPSGPAFRRGMMLGAVVAFAGAMLGSSLALAANPHPAGTVHHSEHDAMIALVPPAGASHTAVRAGGWCDPATWGSGVPGAAARVLVPSGVTVTVDCDTARLDTLRVDGELEWANVASRMQVETLVVDTTGRLEIGTAAAPITAAVEIVILDDGPLTDPQLLGRGIIAHGQTEIHGAPKTTHLKVAADPKAGDTSIPLAAAPVGWRVGDTLVLAGTRYDGWYWDNGGQKHHPSQDEVLTITQIAGNVVSFTPALKFDHGSPRADLKTSVANFSRSITIRSENPAARGHVMFMHSPKADVRYAAFVELGRTDKSQPATRPEDLSQPIAPGTNIQGRYPLHFHRTGVASAPAIAVGNVVFRSPGWGFVHHDSAAIFERNASFDTFGAGFVAETGNETGRWSDNIAIYGTGISWQTPKTGHKTGAELARHDMARTGDGFWFQGRMVAAFGNVAASVNTGFVYFHRSQGGMLNFDSSVFAFPEALGLDPNVKPDDAPILHFSGNEAFAAREGLHIEKANQNQGHDLATHLGPFTAWSVLSGAHMSYTSHYIVRDFDLTFRPDHPNLNENSGLHIGTNSSDFTVIDALIAGFGRDLTSSRNVTRGFFPADYHAVDPLIIGGGATIAGFDSVQANPAVVPLQISLKPLVFDGTRVDIAGTKTDGIGRIPIPAGTDDYDADRAEVIRFLERDGYYVSQDSRRWFFLPDFYTDRLTGQVYRAVQLVEIAPSVTLTGAFSGVRQAGTIDPAATPAIALTPVDIGAPPPKPDPIPDPGPGPDPIPDPDPGPVPDPDPGPVDPTPDPDPGPVDPGPVDPGPVDPDPVEPDPVPDPTPASITEAEWQAVLAAIARLEAMIEAIAAE